MTGPRVLDPLSLDGLSVGEPYVAGGIATVRELSPALGTDELKVNAVYLEAGSRFRPHRHDLDQILYYPQGTGVVAVDGGEDVIVPTGQYVLLPANHVHMHGCTDDGPAIQISMMVDTPTTFDVEVPDGWARWRAPA
jgi:quercetin dioxygenase-like cupin family protein